MKRMVKIALAVLGVALILALALPGPVDSVAWSPPLAPGFSGAMAVNTQLQAAELLLSKEVFGAEDIAVDGNGQMYAGMQDGRIVRMTMGGSVSTLANTGGRPLGLDWHPSGELIVADAYKGLLAVDLDGQITVLTRSANGVPFGFTDDVDVASDGRIYFSDASSRFSQSQFTLDLLEAKPHGRLLVYDPKDQSTRVLLDQLYFANGVALSQNEDFVLVNETWRYRIRRLWLKGPRAGEDEIFIDNLPGFPDGISANGAGRFWLALPSPRKASVDKMHPKPWLKNLVARLPAFLQPAAERYGLVVALDEQGAILASYHDPDGSHVWEITSVEEHDGFIYLGSLTTDRVARLPVPEAR